MLVKRRPSPEEIEVFGTKILFFTQDYSKPETFIMYGDPVKEFETNLNFMTIASAQAKDVKIENYEFTETMHVFIDFPMHRLIQFSLPPMKLNDLVFNISRIYMEIFKNFHLNAEICCEGHEALYLKKVKVHPDNVISLIIDQRMISSGQNRTFKSMVNKLFGKK